MSFEAAKLLLLLGDTEGVKLATGSAGIKQTLATCSWNRSPSPRRSPFWQFHGSVGCFDCVDLDVRMGECDRCCEGNRQGHVCGLWAGVRYNTYAKDLKAFLFQIVAHDGHQDPHSGRRALDDYHEMKQIDEARRKEEAKIAKQEADILNKTLRRKRALETQDEVKRVCLEVRASHATAASEPIPLGNVPAGIDGCGKCGSAIRLIQKPWGSFYGCVRWFSGPGTPA